MTTPTDQVYDELLVLKCQEGDPNALDQLVSRWNQRLLDHARRLTHHTDGAGDALQEAWMAIVRGIGRLDDPARFRPWAYRIVTHKCTDWIRSQQRRRRLSEEISRQPLADEAAPEASEAESEIERLREALRALPAERRALLYLHYLEGSSVAELANVFAVPEGTIKSRLYHARLHLKNVLERETP